METMHETVVAQAMVAGQEWTAVFEALMAEVAGGFPRGDARLLARQMTQSVLMKLVRRDCWTLAEALGHDGPHGLQHLLSRGSWDHDLARDRLAA
ncbi:transposase [Streptomyces noursei]|uniref:transposase n=1 Tax=Streptomyces noursei TaxID=1971 RepID=UPI0011AEE8C9|nr:transposase [Streptomyces noursei]